MTHPRALACSAAVTAVATAALVYAAAQLGMLGVDGAAPATPSVSPATPAASPTPSGVAP